MRLGNGCFGGGVFLLLKWLLFCWIGVWTGDDEDDG